MRTEQVLACRSRQDAVDSYESKRAMVSSLVRTNKHAFHKAGIRVEIVRRRCAGFGVCPYAAESQVDIPNESLEVRNCGWVAAVRLNTMRISVRCCRSIDRTWKEEVGGCRGRGRGYLRNWQWYPAMTFAFIFLISH